ncbi:hypothetical protein GW17_00058520 [Ensete ventricosum]|nr:hypothetical protein GW17_00058520 [Ensete ventricosum]
MNHSTKTTTKNTLYLPKTHNFHNTNHLPPKLHQTGENTKQKLKTTTRRHETKRKEEKISDRREGGTKKRRRSIYILSFPATYFLPSLKDRSSLFCFVSTAASRGRRFEGAGRGRARRTGAKATEKGSRVGGAKESTRTTMRVHPRLLEQRLAFQLRDEIISRRIVLRILIVSIVKLPTGRGDCLRARWSHRNATAPTRNDDRMRAVSVIDDAQCYRLRRGDDGGLAISEQRD